MTFCCPLWRSSRVPVYWTWSKGRWRSRPPAVHCERLIWSRGEHHRSLSWGSSVSQRSPRLTPQPAGRVSSQSFPPPKSRWLRSSQHGKGGQQSYLLSRISISCHTWASPTGKKTKKRQTRRDQSSRFPLSARLQLVRQRLPRLVETGARLPWQRLCHFAAGERESADTFSRCQRGLFSPRLALWHGLSH